MEKTFTLKEIKKAIEAVYERFPTSDVHELNMREHLSKHIRHELNHIIKDI
jgi:hypothetical protein